MKTAQHSAPDEHRDNPPDAEALHASSFLCLGIFWLGGF